MFIPTELSLCKFLLYWRTKRNFNICEAKHAFTGHLELKEFCLLDLIKYILGVLGSNCLQKQQTTQDTNYV